MHSLLFASTLFAAVPLVAGHGHVLKPAARTPGDAFAAACGQQLLSQQSSDINGNVQGEQQVADGQTDYDASKCDLTLCKGFQYADNTANVQSYTAGQKVDFSIQIAAPHEGVMNVSVVDTATNTPIGEPLISYDDYASNAHTIPANNTAFSVTIPDVGSQCGTAGKCVLQWWWNAASIDQTYESCVDFTIGGGSSGSGSSGSSSSAAAPAASSSAAASSAAATSSIAAAAPSSASLPNYAGASSATDATAAATSSAPAITGPTSVALPSASSAAAPAPASASKATSCKRRRRRNSMGNAA